MSKGLDELLYSGIDVYTKEYGNCVAYTQDCINIIEKELQQKEKLEVENKRLANALKKKKGKLRHYATIKKENQELSETLQLYNEKFAGFERVKADLMKENQELKKKLESEFEDSADDLCKTLIERDKLLNENIDLKFDLSLLKNVKKIEVDYSDELLEKIKNLKRENLEMKANIDSEVDFLTKELVEQQERNIALGTKYEKLKKVIDLLKDNVVFEFFEPKDEKEMKQCLEANEKPYLIEIGEEWFTLDDKNKFNLLKEELTDEVDD